MKYIGLCLTAAASFVFASDNSDLSNLTSTAMGKDNLAVQSVYSIGSAGDHLENQAGNNYNTKNMVDGDPNISQPQKLALTPAQSEQLSRNHYFILNPDQKKLLHKDWDRDTLSILPSNWYDCSCCMYRIDWIHKDSVYVPEIFMPSRNVTITSEDDEEYDGPDLEFGPYSQGLIMGIDGQLYKDGKNISVADLVAKQKKEKKTVVYERNGIYE